MGSSPHLIVFAPEASNARDPHPQGLTWRAGGRRPHHELCLRATIDTEVDHEPSARSRDHGRIPARADGSISRVGPRASLPELKIVRQEEFECLPESALRRVWPGYS